MNRTAALDFLAGLPALQLDLPFSPAIMTRLFSQTGERSTVPLESIAATIEKDQGLTVKVLGVANSVYYGLQSQVGTLSRATAVLGLNEIRSIILSMGLKALAASQPLPPDFDLSVYWRHQYTVAVLARSLAADAGDPEPDDLFTAGLLHDLGKLIIALHQPEHWLAIEALIEERELTPSVAEDLYWGLDHAVIGGLVLKAWDFPAALVETVNWHHAPDLAGQFQTRATLIRVADALVRILSGDDYDIQTTEHDLVVEQGCELFDFDCDELAERCEEISQDEEVEHFLTLIV